MKLNKNAESIAGIMIAVTILAFAMLWIVSILSYNRDISQNYSEQVDLVILKENAENIARKLNLNSINSNETFYIYKDKDLNEYNLFTWATSENYKFINRFWDNIESDNFNWDIYTREFVKTSNAWIDWDNTIKQDRIEVTIKKYNKD
jgi:hypothetical protein